MKRKNYPITNIGSSSLLVIFIILCLVTFGALSITSANRDYQHSRTIADRTTAYYEASNQAERKLAEIDALLAEFLPTGEKELESALRSIDVSMTDSHTLEYTIPIDERQQLQVGLEIREPSREGEAFYRITCWRSIRTKPWNEDTTFHLM